MIVVTPCVPWPFPADTFCGGTACIGWTPGGYKWSCPSPWWTPSYGGDGACVGDCSGSSGGGHVRVDTHWKLRDNRGHLGQTPSH